LAGYNYICTMAFVKAFDKGDTVCRTTDGVDTGRFYVSVTEHHRMMLSSTEKDMRGEMVVMNPGVNSSSLRHIRMVLTERI